MLILSPYTAYRFDDWLVDLTRDQQDITITKNSDMDITASFSQQPYVNIPSSAVPTPIPKIPSSPVLEITADPDN